jgi:hypothetical protein
VAVIGDSHESLSSVQRRLPRYDRLGAYGRISLVAGRSA